jgi:hypothetical protein
LELGKSILEVGMKRRIVSLGIGLLLMLVTISLSGCIDRSKWRAKEHGGPPHWQEDFGRPEYDGGGY